MGFESASRRPGVLGCSSVRSFARARAERAHVDLRSSVLSVAPESETAATSRRSEVMNEQVVHMFFALLVAILSDGGGEAEAVAALPQKPQNRRVLDFDRSVSETSGRGSRVYDLERERERERELTNAFARVPRRFFRTPS